MRSTMSDLYKESLAAVVAVEKERREYEGQNGSLTSYGDWPKDLLHRWRDATAQLRVLRSLTRRQGFQPPDLDPELAWIDDRWFEPKIDESTGGVYWVQTPERAEP
jgi:hypothetical protein